MSDAFGSTASGGLEHDMPGLMEGSSGPQGPRQVPSALGGLASAFQHMFGGLGKPAPQAARMGASPFQAPGQSQVAPPMPGGPRQGGTTASLAVPRGSPQPPANFTPFFKSQPTRQFHEWGQPEAFPALPASFEVPSIYQGAAQFFGGGGGQGLGGGGAMSMLLAAGLGKYAGDYMKGVMAGQEFRAKQARQQMEDHAFKLQQQQEEEHHAYADVFNEHAALQNTTDPTKLDSSALRDDLHRQAMELGDDKMTALIENGASVAQIMWFQQQRDATLRDLQKANAKTEQQTALDEQWGLKPPAAASASSTPSDWRPGGATATAAAPSTGAAPDVATGQAAPATQPTQQPDASGQFAGPGVTQPQPDQGQPESFIDSGAAQIFKGYEPGTYVPPDVKNAMAIKAADMRRRAQAILTNPNIKPDQVMPEVQRQLGGTVASDLKGYSQYRAGPGATGQASGGKEQDYWNLLGDLAQKALPGDPQTAKPGWNKSTYQAVRDFRENAQKPTSPIQRIPTAVNAADNVRKDLDAIQKAHGLVSINSPEDFNGWMGKDPLFAQLKIDWIRYNEDIDVLTRGSPSVGMSEQAIGTQPQFPYLGSLSGYRAAVRRDMDQAQSRVQEMHGTWNQYQTGDPMPGFNPQAEASMAAISKMDFNSGALPGEVRTYNGVRARYTAADPENPADQANWEPVE